MKEIIMEQTVSYIQKLQPDGFTPHIQRIANKINLGRIELYKGYLVFTE